MIEASELFGERIMRAVNEAARVLGCEEGIYYCGELPDHPPEGYYYAIFANGEMVRGEYPEGTEALVTARVPGGEARHYQLLS